MASLLAPSTREAARLSSALSSGCRAAQDRLTDDGIDRHRQRRSASDPNPDPILRGRQHIGEEGIGRRIARLDAPRRAGFGVEGRRAVGGNDLRSEEHTSELQSLMRISYAVFCLKKKNK